MPFKKINDIILDILGWIMSISSVINILRMLFTTPVGEGTVKQYIPSVFVLVVGIILVYLTLKKAGAIGVSYFKKKLGVNEKTNN